MQPGQGSFDIPAMNSQAAPVRGVALGEKRRDAVLSQPLTLCFAVIATVALDALRTKFRASESSAQDQRDRFDQWLQVRHVVDVRRRHLRRQRNASGFGQDVMFRPCFGAIRRIGANFDPPKTARPDELSTKALDQSSLPSPCSNESMTWCSIAQTPAACQSRNLRQQVIPEPQPISRGRSDHALPVLRINKMPVNAFRSSIGWRPGNRFRRGFGGGNNGWTISHNSSDTIGFAITGFLSLQGGFLFSTILLQFLFSFCYTLLTVWQFCTNIKMTLRRQKKNLMKP